MNIDQQKEVKKLHKSGIFSGLMHKIQHRPKAFMLISLGNLLKIKKKIKFSNFLYLATIGTSYGLFKMYKSNEMNEEKITSVSNSTKKWNKIIIIIISFLFN